MNAQSLARVLRTVRHLRPLQAVAQVEHLVRGLVAPVPWSGAAPRPAFERAAVPFLGAPAHVRFRPPATVELLAREVRFAERIDWGFAGEGPLFAYHLHQFDWARGEDVPPRARAEAMLDWISHHPSGIGWDPHPISLRVLAWGKLLLTPGALELSPDERERVCASLGSQVETLHARPEQRLQANHLFSNLLAVAFAGLVFEGPRAEAWRGRCRDLSRQLAGQVLADGCHEERSPMYHALLLENVLDLLNVARVGERTPPGLVAELVEAASRMLGALSWLSHPDGEIALFADSAFGIAQRPDALAAYARALGVEPRVPTRPGLLERGGYARLAAGPFQLIASVAGPSPAHQPGHAHCDALAFELSVDGRRVVADTGVCEYRPGALRDRSRATSSHATVEVGGAEQSELWAAHRVGGRARVQLQHAEAGRVLEATCAGWSTRDTVHRRRFELDADALVIHDAIEGRTRPVRLFLPLAPGLRPRLVAASRAVIAGGEGAGLAVELPEGVAWRVEERPYFPSFGRERVRACLVGEAAGFRRGTWRLTRS